MWSNVDYVHSLNSMCKINEPWNFHKSKIEGNTGFYFVRSNRNTIKLWADAFAAAPKYPKLDDQAIFWKVIRTSKDPSVLPLSHCRSFDAPADLKTDNQIVSCVLDTCMFSSGMISKVYVPELTYEMLLSNLKTLNESIVTLHANYISGNEKKMMRMKEYGFWLANNIEPTSDPNNVAAAAEMEVGACPMSGFEPDGVHRVLNLPSSEHPVAYLAIGSILDKNQDDGVRVKLRLKLEDLAQYHH
eukprot:gene21696-27746_t